MNTAPGQLAPDLLAAGRELQVDPVAAEGRLRAVLAQRPNDGAALLMLGAALRAQGRVTEATSLLGMLVRTAPGWPAARYHYGLALEQEGRLPEALDCLQGLRESAADLPGLNRALSNLQRALGDSGAAETTLMRYVADAPREPALLEVRDAFRVGDLREAEAILRPFLVDHPNDPWALMLLAEVAQEAGNWAEAVKFYEQILALLPRWSPARRNHAAALVRVLRFPEALAAVDALLADHPDHAEALGTKGSVLSQMGDFPSARNCYERLIELQPTNPVAWLVLGNVLRTLGERDASIAAFRHSLELRPSYGEGWWSLANMKDYRFSDQDVASMESALARADVTVQDRVHLQFALGKAEEERQRDEQAFHRYANANVLWRQGAPDDAPIYEAYVRRCSEVLTQDFFNSRAGSGAAARDPIFVVGMPRSGSTLVEQILASHPAVEGTMELPEVLSFVTRLCGHGRGVDTEAYPGLLEALSSVELRVLGDEYLTRTAVYRRLGVPNFIDKMPNNFLHLGLIHLMLPNARIIDVRRHPMACGWSNFKQHFAQGQLFAYDLREMGKYFREYVRLMAHFDTVLPGRVHRVHYEALVADPEGQVRALLDYCGLPFDTSCLRFHESKRAVWTPSAQQVRQPIYTSELESWRRFEGQLGLLREALGDVVDAYPAVPPSMA